MTYNLGQIVQLRADPSRQGSITEILPSIGGVNQYRVFHSAGDFRTYYEDQLDPIATSPITTDLASALLQSDCLSSGEFRARITAARLSNPQTNALYSLYAARIQHIPFQFKPLLRFLRADQPRLLIADEVGVGKTIEAGLILRELQARQELGNILIVCPKALVWKWQEEMKRFDEDFHPLTAESLRDCLKETQQNGYWPSRYARSIVNIELLRHPNYINGTAYDWGFFELDTPPHFSFVIFDEAHYLRNQNTNSHQIAKFLCDTSEAVVFLTATPVHTGQEDLYSLLHLLRPDLLPDFGVFQQMIEPNFHLHRSMRHIRTRLPEQNWQDEGLSEIKKAMNTEWGKWILQNDPRVIKWTERLSNQVDLDDEERIRFLGDLEEVHTLAHLMNRTRRRDIGRFTIREPQTVEVQFTQLQREFYEAIIDFQRQVLALEYDPLVIGLITDTLQRRASSCLPALLSGLNNFVETGRFSSTEITDDNLEFDDNITWKLPVSLVDDADHLRYLANKLPPDDPKLERLTRILDDVLKISRPKKVLVFSFFLDTLEYLEEKLSDRGYRVRRIIGKTPEQDRQSLRRRFRLPNEYRDAIDILLSSEVGCEGLDYEFCDCLVNYDIPWNPMKIEQRIGRIDRFGQKSEKVLIYNFITPGTVEERIFFRCYERLDIFRNTIGDLEEVLGKIVKDLNRVVYDPTLTLEQTDQKAQQMTDNAIRRIEEQRRLEEESGSLLGFNQAFIEEVEALTHEGRFVGQNDLAHMIDLYVESEFDGKIIPDSKNIRRHRLRLKEEARRNLLDSVSAQKRSDRASTDFKRWLNGNEPTLLITYDQETALDHREIPFITPIHPLTKAAVEYWKKDIQTCLVGGLLVRDSDIPIGSYLFALYLWETIGIKDDVRLKTFAWDIHQNKLSAVVSSALLRLIERASDLPEVNLIRVEDVQNSMEEVEKVENEARKEAVQKVGQDNNRVLDRQLVSLKTHYRNRFDRIKWQLHYPYDESIRRMGQAQKAKLDSEFESERAKIEQKRERGSTVTTDRIAVGILQVQKE